MHSPDENKVYFTRNWQIENEHFVILVLKEIHEMEELKRNHELRVDEFSRGKIKLHAVDNESTFQVNQRYFHFLVNLEDC